MRSMPCHVKKCHHNLYVGITVGYQKQFICHCTKPKPLYIVLFVNFGLF